MNSKDWVYKFILNIFLIIVALLLSTYFFHSKFDENSLKSKEYLIKGFNPQIIFGGDSRAERQLNVHEAQALLNLKNGDIVNIAISSGDPLMVNNLIDKYPRKFENATVILSISANQLNDNAKLPGYFTQSMISQLGYFEQISEFHPNNLETLLRYYIHNIKSYVKTSFNIQNKVNEFPDSLGFNGIQKTLNTDLLNIVQLKRSPWYVEYHDGGIKYQLINNSIKEIKRKVKKLYIYTAPFSPTYLTIIEHDNLLKYELSFEEKIQKICIENKIYCKSYIKQDALQDSHFYDIAHLNREGSKIFTNVILNDFNLMPELY
jgi:hypothetical protein